MKNMRAILLKRFIGLLRSARGSALIETALVTPMLATLLLGAADLAQVARTSVEVSSAAKAGAQYGAENGYTAQDSTGIATAAQNEASDLTLVTTSSYSCVCSDGSSSTCANTDCPTSHIEETVTVNTQTTITPVVQIPALPSTWTISGQAVQRCLQ